MVTESKISQTDWTLILLIGFKKQTFAIKRKFHKQLSLYPVAVNLNSYLYVQMEDSS